MQEVGEGLVRPKDGEENKHYKGIVRETTGAVVKEDGPNRESTFKKDDRLKFSVIKKIFSFFSKRC